MMTCRLACVLLAVALCVLIGCKKTQSGGAVGKQRAYPGYTLVQQLSTKATQLIDLEGRVVHSWISKNNLGGGR